MNEEYGSFPGYEPPRYSEQSYEAEARRARNESTRSRYEADLNQSISAVSKNTGSGGGGGGCGCLLILVPLVFIFSFFASPQVDKSVKVAVVLVVLGVVGKILGIGQKSDKPSKPEGYLHENDAEAYLTEARDAAKRGEHLVAIARRSRVLRASNIPQNPAVYAHRGKNYQSLGDASRAADDYHTAIELAERILVEHPDARPRGREMIEAWSEQLEKLKPEAQMQQLARRQRSWYVRWFFDFGTTFGPSEAQLFNFFWDVFAVAAGLLYLLLLPVRGAAWLASKPTPLLASAPRRVRLGLANGIIQVFRVLLLFFWLALVVLAVLIPYWSLS